MLFLVESIVACMITVAKQFGKHVFVLGILDVKLRVNVHSMIVAGIHTAQFSPTLTPRPHSVGEGWAS